MQYVYRDTTCKREVICIFRNIAMFHGCFYSLQNTSIIIMTVNVHAVRLCAIFIRNKTQAMTGVSLK